MFTIHSGQIQRRSSDPSHRSSDPSMSADTLTYVSSWATENPRFPAIPAIGNPMLFNLPGFGMPAWGSQPPNQRVPQPLMQHSFLSALAPAADAFILPVNFAAAAVWGHSGIALQTWGLAPPFSTPQHVQRPSPQLHPNLLMPGMWLPGVVGSSASFVGQQEQGRTSSQRTNKQDEVGELASRLTAFYFKYNPAKLDSVAEVSRNFVGKEQELNDALMRKYKKDLKSMVGASILSGPVDQSQTDKALLPKPSVERTILAADTQTRPTVTTIKRTEMGSADPQTTRNATGEHTQTHTPSIPMPVPTPRVQAPEVVVPASPSDEGRSRRRDPSPVGSASSRGSRNSKQSSASSGGGRRAQGMLFKPPAKKSPTPASKESPKDSSLVSI